MNIKTSYKWTKLGSRLVYENQFVRLIEDDIINPAGKKGTYNILQTPGPSVFVIPITKQGVFLINLYRYTSKVSSWELPGGNCGNENIVKAASRELTEETGFESKNLIFIGSFYPLNGISDEISHVYLAYDLVKTSQEHDKEEGITKVKLFTFTQIRKMIMAGHLSDGQTLAALMLAVSKKKISF